MLLTRTPWGYSLSESCEDVSEHGGISRFGLSWEYGAVSQIIPYPLFGLEWVVASCVRLDCIATRCKRDISAWDCIAKHFFFASVMSGYKTPPECPPLNVLLGGGEAGAGLACFPCCHVMAANRMTIRRKESASHTSLKETLINKASPYLKSLSGRPTWRIFGAEICGLNEATNQNWNSRFRCWIPTTKPQTLFLGVDATSTRDSGSCWWSMASAALD